MQRLACASIVLALSGCFIYFDDDGPPVCALTEPAIAPADLRDPADLMCKDFGYPCDAACGPCPAVAEQTAAIVTPSQPAPSWGACGSSCEGLGESECAARSDCRVVKDAFCAFEGVCLTDFMGCFPTDLQVDTSLECAGADAWTCSRNPDCTAWHHPPACSPNALANPALTEDCPRAFALCAPEGVHPGRCDGAIACDEAAPACPAGTTPGIESGCYTGACIPLELCDPQR